MLYVSLVVSALLLFAVNRIARVKGHGGKLIVYCNLAFAFFGLLATCVMPVVLLQSLLLCLAVVVWRISGRGASYYLALSCGATVVAYGVGGLVVLNQAREYARLRKLYPFESMEFRVPSPKPGTVSLSAIAESRLTELHQEIRRNFFRDLQLDRLHRNTLEAFVNSPGFGSARTARLAFPSEDRLKATLRRGIVPRQPGSRFTSIWSPGDVQPPSAVDEWPLRGMLEASYLDFVNPLGFGYLWDRRHVAGFEVHQFSEVPKPANRWAVQRLELVGLLLHDEPVVYVSDHLPTMDQARRGPVRPLDRFERFALDEIIRGGDDLFVAAADEGLRMLGAVRAAPQCVRCHAAERGDLLGGFSYNLRLEGPALPGSIGDERGE